MKGHSDDIGNDKADDRVQWGKGPGPYSRFTKDGDEHEGDSCDSPASEEDTSTSSGVAVGPGMLTASLLQLYYHQ